MNHALRRSLFRILRVTVLVLVLIAAAMWLRNILTSLESEQAVINAEIIQIRTPIAGVLGTVDSEGPAGGGGSTGRERIR